MSLNVDIRKRFSGFQLEAKFSVEQQTLGLLGGSGSGKSMTLKCIAGVVTPDEGYIELDGRVMFDSSKRINVPPQRRNVGFLFQNYALFPNMTVKQNVLCGMKRNRKKNPEQIYEIMSRLYLNGLEKRYPSQLSGGQQQRTALARILVSEPSILLLDEPFSALDAYLRGEMEREVLELLRDFCGPAVVVSHDRDEIYHMCDQIAVYHRGKIDVIGEKKMVFSQPVTREAALLTGCRNVIPAHAEGRGLFAVPGWGVVLQSELIAEEHRVQAIGIRAHSFKAVAQEGTNVIACRIESVVESPFEMVVYLRPIHGQDLLCWKTDKKEFNRVKEQTVIYLEASPDHILPLV